MKATLAGLAALAAVAFAPAANAQVAQQLKPGVPINITGAVNGAATTFQFVIDHFEARGGRVFAVGALSGTSLPATAQGVAIPLRNANTGRGDGNDDRGGFGGFGSLQQGPSLTEPALFQGSTRSSLFQSGADPLIVPAQTATCPILNLVLGPLHLNLLGLVVDLNQVVLNITAVAGPGNLLGNLLCAVAGLLNNLTLGGGLAGAVANLLNQVFAALGGLGL